MRAELLSPEERMVMGVSRFCCGCRGLSGGRRSAQRSSEAHPDLSGPPLVLASVECATANQPKRRAFEQSIRVNPRNPAVFIRYRVMATRCSSLSGTMRLFPGFERLSSLIRATAPRITVNLHAAIAAAQALCRRHRRRPPQCGGGQSD